MKDYFPMPSTQATILDPLKVAESEGQYDIKITVAGGGFKGQSEAIRMAISRSLVKINEDFKKPLKDKKFLTRDAREVERKKFGKPKARKSFQFSKQAGVHYGHLKRKWNPKMLPYIFMERKGIHIIDLNRTAE
ncbi:unnamed protein product, partial [Darwinula stevensoni]